MLFLILMRRQHLNNTTFFCDSQTCHTKEGEQQLVGEEICYLLPLFLFSDAIYKCSMDTRWQTPCPSFQL